MVRSIQRVSLYFLLSFIFITTILSAEVVFTEEGFIFIGTIIQTEQGYSSYQFMDREVRLMASRIIRTEADIDVLTDLPVRVELMDGSILRGTIVDYAPDIGIFLDIDFGVLTIPKASIRSIIEPMQGRRYSGNPFQAKAGASWYFPIGESSGSFGSAIRIEGLGAYSISGIRGLSIGLDFTYSFTNFNAVPSVDYAFITLEPFVSFRYLAWRTKPSIIRILTPFAELGAGALYVRATDPFSVPSMFGELCAGAFIKTGFDFELFKIFSLRAQLRFDSYLQNDKPFLALSAGILGGI